MALPLLSETERKQTHDLGLSLDPNATWTLQVKIVDRIENSSINFKSYNILPEQILSAQRLALHIFKPKPYLGKTTVSQTEIRRFRTILLLLQLIANDYKEARVSELSKSQLIEIAAKAIIFKLEPTPHKHKLSIVARGSPLSIPKAIAIISALKLWHSTYHLGFVSDGPEYNINRGQVLKVAKPIIEQYGLNFQDWCNGGTYGSIPFVIAHLLLADALDTLNSTRSKELTSYFQTVRELNSVEHIEYFWSNYPCGNIHRYRQSGEISEIHKESTSIVNAEKFLRCKKEFILPIHNKLKALHAKGTSWKFPWTNHSELNADYNKLQGAIYVIFLSVMGNRGLSEILPLRGCDITPSGKAPDNNATVRPSIYKTNHGVRTEQGVTNFIDDAFHTILNLGYVDKLGTTIPVFSAPPFLSAPLRSPKRISVQTACDLLSSYYESFCERVAGKIDFNVLETHRSITSHQFRHSFAEFALRKFDGNVEELIRQHFHHSHNHWWTKRYTGDKLDSDRKNSLNKAYIRELVPRIAADSEIVDQDFVGGMALFIKSQISSTVKHMTPEETETYIGEFCDGFIQLTAHEYGWCLLHKEFRSQAKCANDAGQPQPSNTSSEKCNGCVNFCSSRASHLSTQTQIAISHIDFLEQSVWKVPKLKMASIKAVSDAQKLFPELKRYGVPQ